MTVYHKIQTLFKRNPDDKFKTILEGEFSLPEFEYLQDNLWHFTEKVDGTNIRIIFDGEAVTFGGKTDNAQIPAGLVNALNSLFPPTPETAALFKEKFDGPCVLYGEGYGGKIQKGGGNYRQDQGFVLFDVKVGPWWLERLAVEDVASFFDLRVVPLIWVGKINDMVDLCKSPLQSVWGDFQAEGVVARPVVGLMARNGKRIITKLKCKDFP